MRTHQWHLNLESTSLPRLTAVDIIGSFKQSVKSTTLSCIVLYSNFEVFGDFVPKDFGAVS